MDALEGHLALDRTSLLLAPGYHAVCYPLPHRKHDQRRALRAPEADAMRPATAAAPCPGPRCASPAFDAIMAAAGDTWGYWPLATVATPRWHDGGIGLIGDAAHAMLPFQAQGAAMAIEDAAILAPLLMTEPTRRSRLSPASPRCGGRASPASRGFRRAMPRSSTWNGRSRWAATS